IYFLHLSAVPLIVSRLSLHDALPICTSARARGAPPTSCPDSSWCGKRYWRGRKVSARRRPPRSDELADFASNTPGLAPAIVTSRSEEHTSELQSRENLVCRLLLEKKK